MNKETINKETILIQIRRIAEENGGIAPGRTVFMKETGIRESDWSGKYWVKWSDAIIDAGLEPNKYNEAMAERLIYEKYALVIRELGRIPTNAELRIRSVNDTSFPSHNTFNRIGLRNERLFKMLKFARDNIEWNDIIEFIPVVIDKEIETPKATSDKNCENGYVYLLKFGSEYKIGSSINVERRFREIRTQMPYEGKIIHSITTGDPSGIESYWHNYFKSNRLNGEWFKLSDAEVKYFMKRKLM